MVAGPRLDAVAPLSPSAWLRYDVVTRMIPVGVKDVLEVGCGRGAFGARIASGYNYLGLEPDEASYEVARQRIAAVGRSNQGTERPGRVLNTSTQALGDEKFDLVCAFEVIEHIEDDVAAAKEWVTHIRPGGWMLLSVPADQDRFGPMDEYVGHFRRYSPEQMSELLAGAGLSSIVVRRYNFPLGKLLEAGRNALGKRRLAKSSSSVAERTAASGRLYQPGGSLVGTVNRMGTAPLRGLQRRFPDRGVGLVALGRLDD
jgi:SAM-dependent methyltransferase